MKELASTQPQTSLHSAWHVGSGFRGWLGLGFFVFFVLGIGLGFVDLEVEVLGWV